MTDRNTSDLNKANTLLREQTSKIQQQLEIKIAELSMVREIGMTLLHIRNFKDAVSFILDVVINNTIAQNCSIMLLDQNTDQLYLAGATAPSEKHFVLDTNSVFSKKNVLYTFRSGEGAAGLALQSKKTVIINEAATSPYFIQKPDSSTVIGSLISLPLLIENEPIGVLNLSHAMAAAFDNNEIHLFAIIANFVALSIHSTLNTASLEFSEAKYRALAENSNDGIAIIQEGCHAYANPKYEQLTQFSYKELSKIPLENILRGRVFQQHIKPLLNGETAQTEFEAEIISRTNLLIPVEINSAAILYEGKNAAILSVRDLSHRKKIEKQLRHSQKMETIGTLAGAVAHDLNNILSGLVSYPELLLLELPQDSPLRNPIKTIQKSGEKAAAIVQDLLSLARRGVVITKVVNLNKIIADYLVSAEHRKIMTHYPRIELETNLQPELLNIVGSSVHLSRALMNLIANAAEAIHDDGKIIITTANRYLDVPLPGNPAIREGEYSTLTVTDTGFGIPAADLDRIFEPFYTKKKMGRSGTGLGLAVVMGTINDHEGYVDVQSTEGAGATFTLFFPAIRKELSAEQPAPASFDSLKGNGESILIVDDVLEQRQLALDMLARLGYKAVAVASGEEAVSYLLEHKVDLLLLDMIMDPGMNGLKTYRKISKTTPQQKAIIVSGYSETEQVRELQKIGAGAYIKKPYLLETIGKAVQAELARDEKD